MAMDVLITGADTDLGRAVADGFNAVGHRLLLTGVDADALEAVARGVGGDAVVCDPADPAGLADAQLRIPHDLDAVVIVPPPARISGDPRAFTLADTAVAWRSALDRTVVSTVLTVQAIGDHLRSGGSIVAVVPVGSGTESGPEAAAKAALTTWTSAQADHFGARGITINTVACGRAAQPGYQGLAVEPPSAATEIARMALFLATPAARHITGQTMHVGRGAAVTYG
jgi:NAD(P)-dependent dehydrogenase (short-subunit alcohol dehydrogenase family)